VQTGTGVVTGPSPTPACITSACYVPAPVSVQRFGWFAVLARASAISIGVLVQLVCSGLVHTWSLPPHVLCASVSVLVMQCISLESLFLADVLYFCTGVAFQFL
jgi:hypothetical protein